MTISTAQTTGSVTYDSPVVFQGNVVYSCGSAGTITFNQTVDANTFGVDSLAFDFDPCQGTLIFNGPVGSQAALASVSVNAPVDVQVNSTLAVGSFSVTNGTGTTTIASGMTSSSANGISVSTPTISLMGAITTANGGSLNLDTPSSGTVTIGSGTSFNLSGPFQQTGGGAVSIGGNVMTHNATVLFSGPVSMSGPLTLNSDVSTGGDIIFENLIQGAQNLIINSGGSDITFDQAVGTAVTPLSLLKIVNAGDVTANSSIFANSIAQLTGSGTTTFAALTTNGNNGIALNGSAFIFNGAINMSSNGSLSIQNTGMVTFNSAASGSIGGSLTQTGSGTTQLASHLSTTGAITFNGPLSIVGNAQLTTSNQPINLLSTLDGAGDLSLSSGTSDIVFGQNVGNLTSLGNLVITSARNISTVGIQAASLTQNTTGLATFNGNLSTTGSSGISLTGNTFAITGNIQTTNGGGFNLSNSGLATLNFAGNNLLSGGFVQIGGGW